MQTIDLTALYDLPEANFTAYAAAYEAAGYQLLGSLNNGLGFERCDWNWGGDRCKPDFVRIDPDARTATFVYL